MMWFRGSCGGGMRMHGVVRSIFILLLCLAAIYRAVGDADQDTTAGAGDHARILSHALEFLGRPYVPGGMDPSGFDCSGFVCYLYSDSIGSLPRRSSEMARVGTSVGSGDLQPGDLLFFQTMGPSAGISHVAIYLGEGEIVHAVSNGPETGVIVSSIHSGYWRRTYHHARRVLPAAVAEVTVRSPSASAGGTAGGATTGTTTAGATGTRRETSEASPWETFDGKVYGDYEEWRRREDEAFEAYKQRDAAGARNR